MSVLANLKHEAFAQGLAEGKDQKVAYAEAGYTTKWPDRASTECLKKHPEIAQRAKELRDAAEARAAHALDRAAELSGTSKSYVMKSLHEVAERCMQHYPVLDKEGQQVYVETADGKLSPAYTFDSKGATRALHLLGLEHGMFAQRFKLERSPFDGLPATLIQQIVAHLAHMRGRTFENEPGRTLPTAVAPGVGSDPST